MPPSWRMLSNTSAIAAVCTAAVASSLQLQLCRLWLLARTSRKQGLPSELAEGDVALCPADGNRCSATICLVELSSRSVGPWKEGIAVSLFLCWCSHNKCALIIENTLKVRLYIKTQTAQTARMQEGALNLRNSTGTAAAEVL